MEIKKLKPVFKYIKKSVRPILASVVVNEDGIQCTDLDTSILIKNDYGLTHGLMSLDNLDNEYSNSVNEDFVNYPLMRHEYLDESVLVSVEDLKSVYGHSSKDETRPFLCGVAFNRGHIVATTGYTLKEIKTDETLEGEYIIPRSSLAILFKLLKGFKVEGLLKISFNEDFAVVESSKFLVNMRLIKREFPKWEGVIPAKFTKEFMITDWINFKKYKKVLNPKSFKVMLKAYEGDVWLCGGDEGSEVLIGKSEGDFELCFNCSLLDLASESMKEFKVQWNNEVGPTRVGTSIVMPMKG